MLPLLLTTLLTAHSPPTTPAPAQRAKEAPQDPVAVCVARHRAWTPNASEAFLKLKCGDAAETVEHPAAYVRPPSDKEQGGWRARRSARDNTEGRLRAPRHDPVDYVHAVGGQWLGSSDGHGWIDDDDRLTRRLWALAGAAPGALLIGGSLAVLTASAAFGLIVVGPAVSASVGSVLFAGAAMLVAAHLSIGLGLTVSGWSLAITEAFRRQLTEPPPGVEAPRLAPPTSLASAELE